ncbi:MAG: hypothetical protein NZ700_07575 [Gemmataceae bacterium]|nr:hypothetical protein [Gemmataceae bacterium]MDW8267160.1 hypothetical protein [Gemmataceae bacterium]
MSTPVSLSERPLSLWRVDFHELYARHLCRHSQFGNNVVHLVAVFGTWLAIYGLVRWLVGTPWAAVGLAVAHLLLLAVNIPARLALVSGLFMALTIAVVWLLPPPWWLCLVLVPVCYVVQNWGHRIWTVEKDMTEFNRKYPKGSLLFTVLTLYEIPILLNYLVFNRSDWS